MAQRGRDIAEFTGQGAIGASGRGPEGSLAGQYAVDAAGLSGLGDAIGRLADRQASAEGETAGAAAALEGKPQITGRSSYYGAAYEQAAIQTYAARLDARQTEETFKVYEQFKDDPAALGKGLADLKERMLSEEVLDHPVARATFERQFARSAFVYQKDAIERADVRARQQAAVDTATAADAMGTNLQRLAHAAGEDPQSAEVLAQERQRYNDSLDRAVAAGSMTPAGAAALKERMGRDVTVAQVKGQFAKLPEAERPTYAAKLMDDWQNGKGPLKDLDFHQASALSADLERDLKAQTVATATVTTALEHQVKKVQDLGAAGYDVADTEWKEMDTLAARVKGGPQVVEALRRDADTFRAWRNMGPDALERALDVERGRAAKGGTDELGARRIAAGEKLLKEMRTELGKDPLGWAERTGIARVAPIALDDPGSMAARTAQAEAVAQHYSVKPVYLRPDEKAALAQAQAAGGQVFTANIAAVVTGFGDRAPRVLAEVSDEAPMLARAGALVAVGGSTALAEDVATTVQRRNEPGYKAPQWKNDKLSAASNDVYGAAFLASPRERLATETVARTAFENRIGRQGFDPHLGTSDSQKGYERTLQEAAGATFDADGNQYGGVTSHDPNGWFNRSYKVVAPTSVRADRFDRVVDALRDEDLVQFGPVAGGKPVSARTVQAGHLVAVGVGRYRVATGDPAGDDPQWLTTPDGRYFVLDLNALEGTLRTRVPGAYKGGR
ncbi:hypothetical protein [Xanthobacter versatilis]|uniref:hypothetical protein n=1 Tax=Xanthobacter autotrophicus (strain ATCC BAA-1158 / Py2) TaxID=78245 RepID=UPI00372BAA7B